MGIRFNQSELRKRSSYFSRPRPFHQGTLGHRDLVAPGQNRRAQRLLQVFLVLCLGWSRLVFAAAERELIRDSHFQHGFFLIDPKPGTRVPYGELPGPNPGQPAWDLAQWSSRFPLRAGTGAINAESIVWTNAAKTVLVGLPGKATADLSLGVNAGAEYARARRSTAEPWVHLLVQQDLEDSPSLGGLAACKFHLEARLKRSVLITTNDYSPSLHAAQFLVYLTVANRNPKAAGYQECLWFGIPIYDNRNRVVPAYEAQDFGDTKLFIFTPASDNFTRQSVHDGTWVTFEKDLLPLLRQAIEHARAKGLLKARRTLPIIGPWEYSLVGKFPASSIWISKSATFA